MKFIDVKNIPGEGTLSHVVHDIVEGKEEEIAQIYKDKTISFVDGLDYKISELEEIINFTKNL